MKGSTRGKQEEKYSSLFQSTRKARISIDFSTISELKLSVLLRMITRKSTIPFTSSFALILFLILFESSSRSSSVQEIVSSQKIVRVSIMICTSLPPSNSESPTRSVKALSQNAGYEIQMRETIIRQARLVKNLSERILSDYFIMKSKVTVRNSSYYECSNFEKYLSTISFKASKIQYWVYWWVVWVNRSKKDFQLM